MSLLLWLATQFVQASAGPGVPHQPQIIQLGNGRILVAFATNNDVGVGSDGYDILAQIYDVSGNHFSGPIRLNREWNSDDEIMPAITTLPSGGFAMSYIDREIVSSGNPPLIDQDIRIESFNALGQRRKVNTIRDTAPSASGGGQPRAPRTAALSNVNTLTIWSEGAALLSRSWNPELGNTNAGTLYTVQTVASGVPWGYDLAALPDQNEYIIAYGEASFAPGSMSPTTSMRFIRTNLFGTVLGPAVIVADTATRNYDPSIAVLPDGRFVISWTSDSGNTTTRSVRYRIFNADGTAASQVNEIPVTTPPGDHMNSEVVALSDGGFIVFWHHARPWTGSPPVAALHARVFSATGATVGDEILLSFDPGLTLCDPVPADLFGSAPACPDEYLMTVRDISAALLEDGRIGVSWEHHRLPRNLQGRDVSHFERRNALFGILDARSTHNLPDSNGNVMGGPINNTITIEDGTVLIDGHSGINTYRLETLGPLATLARIKGGEGTDRVYVNAPDPVIDLRAVTFEEVDQLMIAGAPPQIPQRRIQVSYPQMQGLNSLWFSLRPTQPATIDIHPGPLGPQVIDLSALSVRRQRAQDQIIIRGGVSNDTITGTEGNDLIIGGAGNDTILGGGGNDTIRGGAGANVLQGGTGRNTLEYTDSPQGVTVNLQTGFASGGHATGDTFSGFTDLTGSAQADALTGDGRANVIRGGAGNDTIRGGGGADSLYGGHGDDLFIFDSNAAISNGTLIDGGAGHDIVELRNAPGVSLTNMDFRRATFASVEELRFRRQGTTAGTGITMRLHGQQVLEQLPHDLQITGNNVAGRIDRIEITTSAFGGHAASPRLDLSGWSFRNWQRQNPDALVILGTSGNDMLVGSSGNDEIYGNAGNDLIIGGPGNDTLVGGAGDDTIEGGPGANLMYGGTQTTPSGTNTLSYANSRFAVNVNLATGAASGGYATGDVFHDFQSLIGSAHNDTLTGGADSVLIEGGAGSDLLISHSDPVGTRFSGGTGNDILRKMSATSPRPRDWESYDGTDGINLLHWANPSITREHVVDLGAGRIFERGAARDFLSNIRNVMVDNDATVRGDHQDNTIWANGAGGNLVEGVGGNNTLISGGGRDMIQGGTGNDRLVTHTEASGAEFQGGGGDNVIEKRNAPHADRQFWEHYDGGSGTNLFHWTRPDITGAYAVDLTAGRILHDGEARDYLSNVINVTTENDALVRGDAQHNLIVINGTGGSVVHGMEGHDTIIGGAGNDTIYPGPGRDVLTGGPGADIFVWEDRRDIGRNSHDIITDFTPGEDRIDLSAIDADENSDGHQTFTFIGAAEFSGTAGELRYDITLGHLQGDVTGNGNFNFYVVLQDAPALTEEDLILE